MGVIDHPPRQRRKGQGRRRREGEGEADRQDDPGDPGAEGSGHLLAGAEKLTLGAAWASAVAVNDCMGLLAL